MLTDDDSVIVLADNMATSNNAGGEGEGESSLLHCISSLGKKQYIVLARVQVK